MKNGLIFTLLFVLIINFPPIPHTASAHATNFVQADQMESNVKVNISQNPFIKTFTVEAETKDLDLEVFTLSGDKIPSTIYRHHSNGMVKYETGADLNSGIYLVRLSTEEYAAFYKMIKLD